jgi:dephospho-CoA kinase
MIIGITGTNGSGKGTVVEYLVAKGFTHYSARGLITKEVERRGFPVNRDNTRLVANDLRQQHGPDYVIRALYGEAREAGGDAVIESLRTVGEAKFLRGEGGLLFATDADRALRYERITARQSALDKVSFEQFCEQEDREMNATDPWDMNIAGVMAMADYTIQNNGTVEELRTQVDEILEKIKK